MRSQTVLTGITILLATTVSACEGDRGAPDADLVTVRDSAGIEIVENLGPIWGAGEGWTVSPEPNLLLGAVASDDPAFEFSRIAGATRLSDGRIVVVEGLTAEIRWFDAEGRHLATRGGRGGGPAEFNAAFSLHRLPGDTILVEDRPRIRHVLFGPDMEFARAETLDQAGLAETGQRAECADMTLPDRSLLLCRPEPGGRPAEQSGHFRSYSRFVRLSWDLTSESRMGLYGGLEQWGVDMGDGRTRFEIHPFHARTATAAGGDPLRVATALNPEYSVEIWTPDGRLERIVRRPGAERMPTAQDRTEVRERFAQRVPDEVIRNRFLAEMDEPDTVPPIRRLTLGPGGDLWILRDTQSAPERVAVHDVFNAQGRFLGEVHLPEGTFILEVGEDYLLGLRMDEMGVPFVELYRLERAA